MALNPGTQRQLVDERIGELKRTVGQPEEHQAPTAAPPAAFAIALRPSKPGRLTRRVGTWLVHTGQRLGGPIDAQPSPWEPGFLGSDGPRFGAFGSHPCP